MFLKSKKIEHLRIYIFQKTPVDYFTWFTLIDVVLPNDDDNNNTLKLLHDRVEFKLFAAEQHLDRLKEIGDIAKDNARIEVEMEIDCFLSQLLGAVDSLLFQINDKLELGIPPDRVSFPNVQSALSAKTKKIDLVSELDEARQRGKWYALLDELRNQSVHGTFLVKKTTTMATQGFSSNPSEVRFLKVQRDFDGSMIEQVVIMNLEVMPYLEKSLQQTRELIYYIRTKEPLLLL